MCVELVANRFLRKVIVLCFIISTNVCVKVHALRKNNYYDIMKLICGQGN